MRDTATEAISVWLLHHYNNQPNQRFADLLHDAKPGWHFDSIPGKVNPGYRSRLRLYLLGWPCLFLYGLTQGLRTIGRDRGNLILVAWSHLPLLPIVLLGLVLTKPPPLVLYGFIYTQRPSRMLNYCRRWYFRALLSRVSLVICHSRHECEKYREWFGREIQFVYAPFCLDVPGLANAPKDGYAVSAGRSGRDYPLLLRAFAGIDLPLKIVCDHFDASNTPLPGNVEILRGCYDGDYLQVLAGARLVIIPLAVNDVSAGQMVLLQAMAMEKPIVVTRTTTIEEYATDGHDCIFVTMGDEKSLRESVRMLLNEPERIRRIGANAVATYQERFSIASEARHLVTCLEHMLDANACHGKHG